MPYCALVSLVGMANADLIYCGKLPDGFDIDNPGDELVVSILAERAFQMIKLRDVYTNIIIPTLGVLRFDNIVPAHKASASLMLLGIGYAESKYAATEQAGGGPALGYWQVEPFTHDDIWKNFLAYRPELAERVRGIAGTLVQPNPITMINNEEYGCAMARLKLYRSPKPLPEPDDFVTMGSRWIDYNGGGAATMDRWTAEVIPMLQQFVGTMH